MELTHIVTIYNNTESTMNENELRKHGESLRQAYHQLIECYTKEHTNMSQELKDLLSHGVYNGAFSNPEGILICGINPSYDNKEENKLPYNLLTECTGKYWKPYVEIANRFPKNMVGYLDLFPLRVTKQRDLLRIVPIDLKAKFIAKFEEVIEDPLRPKLIIYTNKSTSYLWGTDEAHPWMGYKLSSIEIKGDLSAKGKLYRIEGYNKHSERIGKSNLETACSLNGSYLFITSFYQYAKKETKITADDIQLLWNDYAL